MNFSSMRNWLKTPPKKKWERVPTKVKTYDEFFKAVKALDIGFQSGIESSLKFKTDGLNAREAREAYVHYFDCWIWEGSLTAKKMAEFFEEYIDDSRNPTNFWERIGRGTKPPAS